jgi:hypothetical protein
MTFSFVLRLDELLKVFVERVFTLLLLLFDIVDFSLVVTITDDVLPVLSLLRLLLPLPLARSRNEVDFGVVLGAGEESDLSVVLERGLDRLRREDIPEGGRERREGDDDELGGSKSLGLRSEGRSGPILLRRSCLIVEIFVLESVTECVERGESGGEREDPRVREGDVERDGDGEC